MSLRHLRIAAHVELISLIILLANLATAHLKPISSLIGPAHGCAYLFVVAATWNLKRAATTTKASVAPHRPGLHHPGSRSGCASGLGHCQLELVARCGRSHRAQ